MNRTDTVTTAEARELRWHPAPPMERLVDYFERRERFYKRMGPWLIPSYLEFSPMPWPVQWLDWRERR